MRAGWHVCQKCARKWLDNLGNAYIRKKWQKTSGAEDHIHTGIQSLWISEFYCCLALAYFCRQKAH